MSVFGLDRKSVEAHMTRISAEAGDSSQLESEISGMTERFARAAWSTIVEPGDGDAGMLVDALGAEGALTVTIDQWTETRILSAVEEIDPAIADTLRAHLTPALQRWRPRLVSTTTIRALEQAAHTGARLLTPGSRQWPQRLDDLGHHAPIALWCRGQERSCLALDVSIALVGARASTGYGEHVAMEIASGLVDRGFAIVSGGAYGIDGVAHRTALASGGTTIAFLAGGVDRFYPAGHDALLGRIVEAGAVLSELPCGAAPTRWRFLQRNRLIAAASLATGVLEAGWRSGSLNTAGHAATLGRPLGAVPGPVTSPASAGCHRLIRDYGATCVTDAAEMAELAGDLGSPVSGSGAEDASAPNRPDALETRVLDALSARSPRPVADIAKSAGLAVSTVEAVLGVLELEDSVRERRGGWVAASRRDRRVPLV